MEKVISLAEEIKQGEFKSEYQKALLNIMVTANKIYANNSRFLKSYGISQEQYNVLRILRGQFPNPSTVLNIQNRMLDKMSNASRLVDKLEAKKLLSRKQSKNDRRQVEILISEKGLELLNEIDEPMGEQEKRFYTVDQSSLESLNETLDKIRSHYTS